MNLLHLLLWALLGAPERSFGSPATRPRMSFLLDSTDRGLVHFNTSDIHNTTTLLLSNDGSTLYVGARNAILSLDISDPDVINLKEKRDWSPSAEDTRACRDKQKNEKVDCPNFIRVLQPKNSTHLYACGSYAYNPQDAYLDQQTLALTPVSMAKGRCPFNPFERNTAITVDGELFTGTTEDFKGTQPVISRHFTRGGGPSVRQEASGTLLDEPTFISSSLDQSEGKLYFFFTEVLKEFPYIVEHKGARVAQVCKNDVGGQRTLQKKWTSFTKSLLLCQPPKQQPFDILLDMFTLEPPEGDSSKETLFYGVFTSQWSLGSQSSAVCAFKMQDIRDVFSGYYRTFDPGNHQWSTSGTKRTAQGKCGLGNATDVVLEVVKKSFLSHASVHAAGESPLMVSSGPNGVRYSRLVAVTTQAANQKEYTVLFLLTEKGFLHKVVLLDGGSRVIEEVQVFKESQLVKSLLLSSSKGVVYVGWSGGVTAVPLAHCSTYQSCGQCVLARDPFCSWDPSQQACTKHHTLQTAQDVEKGNVTKQCRPPLSFTPHSEAVQTSLNLVVTLRCARPSDLATVSWTSDRHPLALPQSLFLQRPDGSLSFLAVADTLGVYTCTSHEAGYREVRAVFAVTTPSASTEPLGTGWVLLDHTTVRHTTAKPLPTGEAPADHTADHTADHNADHNADHTADHNADHPSDRDPDQTQPDCPGRPTVPIEASRPEKDVVVLCREKSYHTELVVVSLLLALCVSVMLLSLAHRWSQRGPAPSPEAQGSLAEGDEGSLENDSILKQEPVGPEVTVVV